MYVSIAEVKARGELGLSTVTDSLITFYITRATVILESYVGYGLEETTKIEKILAIPNRRGDLHITTGRRFISSVNSVTIEGKTYTDYFIGTAEGFVEIEGVVAPNYLFEDKEKINIAVDIEYISGFNPLPDEIKEVVYSLIGNLANTYDEKTIEQYKTLNESVRYNKNSNSSLIDDWVKNILDKYKKSNNYIGIYM